jgi:hypothetical protein
VVDVSATDPRLVVMHAFGWMTLFAILTSGLNQAMLGLSGVVVMALFAGETILRTLPDRTPEVPDDA